MKNRKIILTMLLTLCILITSVLIIPNTASAKTYNGFKYKSVSGGVEITGYSGSQGGNLTIPDKIDGKKVVSIGKKAFYECDFEGIHKIGKYVKVIKESAFESCDLYNVNLGESVEKIEKRAFAYNDFTVFTFGNKIKKIGYEAFRDTELDTVPSPDTLEYIGDYAFNSTNISKFIIGKNLKHIGDGVFLNALMSSIKIDKDNKNFILENGVLYNAPKTRLILYPFKSKKASFTVPESVREIAGWAFDYSKLKTIKLHNKINKIGVGAFYECYKLTSINIPKNISVITQSMFEHCKKLKSLKLGGKIKRISDYAFEECGITSIKLTKNIKTIAKKAFRNSKLKTIKFNSALESIGEEAFSGTKITKLELPKMLNKINSTAFKGMSKLKKFSVRKTNKTFKSSNGALYNKKKKTLAAYPDGKKSKTYKLLKSTNKIMPDVFYDHRYIKKVVFNKKLKSIGKRAFEYCEKLTNVSFNKNINTIGEEAFYGCSRISSLVIPKNLRKIGSDAFSQTGIKTLEMKSDKLTMGSHVFDGCEKLETAVVSNFKSKVGGTFLWCENLKSVVFKNNVKQINDSDYLCCGSLESVTIPKSVKKIGKRAFGYYYIISEPELLGPFLREMTIKGYKGTAAEKYATDNGFKFEEINERKEAMASYKNLLENNTKKYKKFSPVYLDDNDVPELVVYDNLKTEAYIYTYYNAAVKEAAYIALIETVEGEFCYCEKTGIYKSGDWWDGGPTGGWTKEYYNKLENGKVKTLDIYSEVDDGYRTPSFYGNKNGKITEQEFYDTLNKYTKGQDFISPKLYDNTKSNREKTLVN